MHCLRKQLKPRRLPVLVQHSADHHYVDACRPALPTERFHTASAGFGLIPNRLSRPKATYLPLERRVASLQSGGDRGLKQAVTMLLPGTLIEGSWGTG